MGAKRKYEEGQSTTQNNPYIHPDRVQKRHKSGKDFSKKGPPPESQKVKEDSLNWMKRRIRDLERQLERKKDDMRADVKLALTQELASHKSRLGKMNDSRKRSQMIGKYHMIRFFERKKAQRFQKQLQKRLAATEEAAAPDREQIEARLHTVDVDWHYTVYYPYLEPYISLYPVDQTKKAKKEKESKEGSEGEEGEDSNAQAANDGLSSMEAALSTQRPPLWKEMEKAMSQGKSALEALRDRKDGTTSTASQKGARTEGERESEAGAERKDRQKQKSSQGRTGAELAKVEKDDQADEDEDEDGGFFDE